VVQFLKFLERTQLGITVKKLRNGNKPDCGGGPQDCPMTDGEKVEREEKERITNATGARPRTN